VPDRTGPGATGRAAARKRQVSKEAARDEAVRDETAAEKPPGGPVAGRAAGGRQLSGRAMGEAAGAGRAAGKRPVSRGARGAARAAADAWPGDQDAAPGWVTADWMLPDEAQPDEALYEATVLDEAPPLAGIDEAAGEWAGGEGTTRRYAPAAEARRNAPAGEWFGGEEAARAACLKLLTTAPRTRAQLAAALRRRRVPDEIAESVLARFTEVGLIDDTAFARAWVESRHHSRGLARKALAAELRQRGISDGEVRAAVDSLGPQEEMAAARQLVMKRLAATRGRPLPARVRQLLGMLARKGYSAGLATQVVREALEREAAEDPDARQDLALICEDSTGSDWA
jgi:regulatory protein